MTERPGVRSLFFTPPMVVARLGGSDTPLDAYVWREDPSTEGGGLTELDPAVSLRVENDGSVAVFRPAELVFRDGSLLRPVAPFLELWVEFADGTTEALTARVAGRARRVPGRGQAPGGRGQPQSLPPHG